MLNLWLKAHLIKFVCLSSGLMLFGSHLAAEIVSAKFYNVEFIIKGTPPPGIFAALPGHKFVRKLNLIYLNDAIAIRSIAPVRLIVDNRQFLFLTVSYEKMIDNQGEFCHESLQKVFYVLEYRHKTLQIHLAEAIEDCFLNLAVEKNEDGTDSILWDQEQANFTITLIDYDARQARLKEDQNELADSENNSELEAVNDSNNLQTPAEPDQAVVPNPENDNQTPGSSSADEAGKSIARKNYRL